MSLQTRIRDARRIEPFASILSYKKNQSAALIVPGHRDPQTLRAKSYTVILKFSNGTITALINEGQGQVACRGNARGYVTYHALAGILAIARLNKLTVAFCNDEPDAEKVARLGGKVYRIVSQRTGLINGENHQEVIWVVLKGAGA